MIATRSELRSGPLCRVGLLLFIAALCPLLFRPALAAAPATQDPIDPLRADLAIDFGNPDAHLTLARAIREQGDPLTAFLICEHARTLFGDDAFAASFDTVFRGTVTDVLFHARRKLLLLAINQDPRNVKLLKDLSTLDLSHGAFEEAAAYLRRACTLTPADFSLVQLLQSALAGAGDQPGADALIADWCAAHPDSAVACERRISDQIEKKGDSVGAELDQAIAKHPTDGQLHFMRAQLDEQEKPDRAEAEYVAAANLAVDSPPVQAGAARFFLTVHHDPERVLQYDLATYFLDPNFNDWESIDQRVRDAADELVQLKLAAAKGAGSSLVPLINDPNPFLSVAAMGQIPPDQNFRLPTAMLRLTTSNSPDVRAASIALFIAHPHWLTDTQIDDMLKSADPWTRSAGASIAANIRHAAAIDELSPLLDDPAALVRFTAASALLPQGSAGRAFVLKTIRRERNGWVKNAVLAAAQAAP